MITINGLHHQLAYDDERYNDKMNNDNYNDRHPVIGPRDCPETTATAAGFQAKIIPCSEFYAMLDGSSFLQHILYKMCCCQSQ